MLKRKRDSDSRSTVDRALDGQISSLKVRIEQGVVQLKKALNLACGFERQKLGRRQKDASKEPKNLLRLREEVIVLKQLDLSTVAERQLLKRLGKVKRILENPAYEHVYGQNELEGPKNGAEANVIGRLMNSNPVKGCLPGIVESVLHVLGLANGPKVKKEVIDENLADRHTTKGSIRDAIGGLTREEDDEWSGTESEIEDGISLDDQSVEDIAHQGSQRSTEVDSEFPGFSEGIAASSEDESNAANQNTMPLTERKQKSVKQEPSKKLSIPKIKVSPSNGSRPMSPEPSKLKPKKEAEAKAPSSTAFLPSLMMGGYYSGSESASDIEEERKPDRKNRRGQRARQKIAEAKFGAKAKHLSKQNSGRNAGWDAKKGAIDGMSNSKGRMRTVRPFNTKGPTGANGDALGARSKETTRDGPMHPSWEAARKRKEQGSKIAINPAGAGMGKKITFE